MNKSVCLSVAILTVVSSVCWAQGSTSGPGPVTQVTQTAVISGTVVSDANGAKLSGAVVTAYRRIPEMPVYRSQGATDATGAFSLASLPAGTYNICVQVPGSNYLDPCMWTTAPPSVTVADGQTAGGNAIRLKTGGVLKVRVVDPGQQLQKRVNDPGPGHVFVGLTLPNGLPVPLPMTKNDSAGLEFQMVVPTDTSLTTLTYSKEVDFKDPDEKPVAAAGGNRNVIVPSGPGSTTVTYTTTGRRP